MEWKNLLLTRRSLYTYCPEPIYKFPSSHTRPCVCEWQCVGVHSWCECMRAILCSLLFRPVSFSSVFWRWCDIKVNVLYAMIFEELRYFIAQRWKTIYGWFHMKWIYVCYLLSEWLTESHSQIMCFWDEMTNETVAGVDGWRSEGNLGQIFEFSRYSLANRRRRRDIFFTKCQWIISIFSPFEWSNVRWHHAGWWPVGNDLPGECLSWSWSEKPSYPTFKLDSTANEEW